MKVYRVTAIRVADSKVLQTDLSGYSAKLLSRRDFNRKADDLSYSAVALAVASKPGADFTTLDSTSS